MELIDYLQNNYAKTTAVAYYKEIKIFLNNHPQANKYNYTQLIKHIGNLRQRYPNSNTLNRIVATLKAYYNYLCHTNQRPDNPAKSIKLRDKKNTDIQLQDLFTQEELETLLHHKTERYQTLQHRNKILISLLIYQGLKPSEIQQLQLKDINLEEGTIYIKPSPKTNSRTLSLKANQILLFKKYIEEIRPKLLKQNKSKTLLIGQRNRELKSEDITKHIKKNYNIYPPRQLAPITIRQSVIRNLLQQNNDLRIVQTFAGHKKPSATQKYKQQQVEELQQALKIYHPIK